MDDRLCYVTVDSADDETITIKIDISRERLNAAMRQVASGAVKSVINKLRKKQDK